MKYVILGRYMQKETIVEIRWAIPCLICIKVFFVNERFMQNTQKISGLSHIAFSLYHIEEMTRRHFSSICSLFVLYIQCIKLHDVNFWFWCTNCTYIMFKLAPPDIWTFAEEWVMKCSWGKDIKHCFWEANNKQTHT